MKLRLFAIVLLLVVGAGAVVLAVRPSAASSDQAQLLTATATRRTVTADAVATGNVDFSVVYDLAFGTTPTVTESQSSSSSSGSGSGSSSSGAGGSSTTWTVKEVGVSAGQSVAKGDVLAVADASDLDDQISAAKTQLRIDRINLRTANDQLDAATTTAATRQARSAVYQARIARASGEQSLADLRLQRSYTTLRAPVAGIVTTVNAVGGLAASGTVVEIGAAPLDVVGAYAESDLAALAVGQPATVTVSATGSEVSGKVVAIAPTASTSGGSSSVVSYDVTIQLVDPPAEVKPGMSADVSVTTATATDVLAVPAVALSGGANGYTVDVRASDGTVQRRPVDVGLVTSSWAEIRSGLSEGDVVVTGTTSTRQSTTNGFGGGLGGGLGGPGAGTFRGGNGANGRTPTVVTQP
ncbi:MAG TPA: efflux RND transporter periplasmic adaptor subunit [Candidatus Limnocylindrales bacterium]